MLLRPFAEFLRRLNRLRHPEKRVARGVSLVEHLEDRVLMSVDAMLVRDINPGPDGSSPGRLANINGTLYFSAGDYNNGQELWRSDGTAAGTTLVKDINPGNSGSSIREITEVGSVFYFTADDGVNGVELWKSNGTAAGTALVKDIRGGGNSGSVRDLTNVNGTLYFVADNGTSGAELWKSDGTAAGTVQVKDIFSGPQSSAPSGLTNVSGVLYFASEDSSGDRELWKSNGTSAGTVRVSDIYSGLSGSRPAELTNIGGVLFFSAIDYNGGQELWKSNGTAAGTLRVKDINPGSGHSSPGNLTNMNGKLYFTATDGYNGTELWKSDGTEVGTVLVKDIANGYQESNPYYLVNVNGTLFFQASEVVNYYDRQYALWKTDGTTQGTVKVRNFDSGGDQYFAPSELTNVDGIVYFRAMDSSSGIELWRSDGTEAGTVLVKDIYQGQGNSYPQSLTVVNGRLFFEAQTSQEGWELWSVGLVNAAPTGLNLSSDTVAENSAPGTVVGVLSPIDLNDAGPFTYTLVSGTGSVDNAFFTIVGNELRTTSSFDLESKNAYEVRVRVTDAGGLNFERPFVIVVTNVNEAPTNLTLSSSSIQENRPGGTAVGVFTASDPDVEDLFSYSFVTGVGSADNASFTIVNGELRTASSFDFESKNSYSVRVRVSDYGGLFFDKQFTVAVTNVNETPTNIILSASSIAENQPIGTPVANLSSTDPDAGNSFTYALVAGIGSTDNSSFTIVNGQLRTAAVFDLESKSSYAIRIRSTDQGGLLFEKQFTITVTGYNTAPTNLNLSATSVLENRPAGTTVGLFTSTDSDVGDTFVYALVSGTGSTDNGSFTIFNNELRTAAVFDFETKNSYQIRVRATDQGGLSFEKPLTITVDSAAPTGLVALRNDGVLHIEGTNGPDRLTIRQTSTQIQVFAGFAEPLVFLGEFGLSSVRQIEVLGQGGNDEIWVGNGNQSLTPVLEILQSDGHDSLFTRGTTFAAGLADGFRLVVLGSGNVYSLDQDNNLSKNGVRTWSGTQDVTIGADGNLYRLAISGQLQQLQAGTSWIDVTAEASGLSLTGNPIIDGIDRLANSQIVAYDFHNRGMITLNVLEHTYYADVDLGWGVKLDTTKLQDLVQGKATLPQIDPIKAISYAVNRTPESNEYEDVRASFYAGIQGGVNSVYMTSERFTNWASPQKILELGVKTYFGQGNAVLNEILAVLKLEFWDMAGWAQRKWGNGDAGLQGLLAGLNGLATHLQHSAYWIPVTYIEGGIPVSHRAMAIQTTDPDSGSLEANEDYFSNPFDISSVTDVLGGGAVGTAIDTVWSAFLGNVISELPMLDSLLSNLGSAAVDSVIYNSLLLGTGINYVAVRDAQESQGGTFLVDLRGTDIEDNIIDFLNGIGPGGKLAQGNEGELSVDKLQFDTSNNSLVVKFDIHHRHVWPSAKEMADDLYTKGKQEVGKIVEILKDAGEELNEIANTIVEGIGDAARKLADALRKLGVLPWVDLSLQVVNGELQISGRATLPLINDVELSGTIGKDGKFTLHGEVHGKTLGFVSFPTLSVTLSNTGLKVDGHSTLPVLGSADFSGYIQTNGAFSLDVKLGSNWNLGGLGSGKFSNFKATLSNDGLSVSGSVSLPGNLSTGTFSGKISSNGNYSFVVQLGTSWKLGVFNKSSFSNFKLTLSNSGIAVSGSISLPAGLVSGTFSGKINSNGTFSFALTLASSWKLAGLSKSSFSNFSVTFSNTGLGISGNVSLPAGLLSGSFSGTINSNGNFNVAVTLGSNWKLGVLNKGLFSKFNVTLSNSGIGVSGTISLPAGLANGTFSGTISSSGTFSLGVTLGSSWKLGVLSKSSFSGFVLTLTNSGIGVSGTVSLPAGLASGTFSGTISTNGTFSFVVTLGSSWKLGGLAKSSFSNFKLTLSNTGIGVSGTVGLPAGLGSGTFSGTIGTNGTFSFDVKLGSSRKLGGFSSSAFPTLKATLSNNGIGVSGKISLGPVNGSFSGTVATNGTFSMTVSLGSTIQIGGASLNATFKISDSGLKFSGKLVLPYINKGYSISGSINTSGKFVFSNLNGAFSTNPSIKDLVRLFRGAGAGFSNVALALWHGGAMYGKSRLDLARALVSGGNADGGDVVNALEAIGTNLFSIVYALGGSGLGQTLGEIAYDAWNYTEATFVDVADALWNSGVAEFFDGGFNVTDLVNALDDAGAGWNSLVSGLRRALNWTSTRAISYLTSLGFGSGGGGGGSGGYIGQTLDRWGISGYLEESTAFFDANKNGVLDPNEPWAITKSAGAFSVPVPVSFDTNGNGVLDDAEGQWVVLGGTDITTGLPAAITLISPASWTVMTPLSTLISELSNRQALSISAAETQIRLALGLPAVDLSSFDPFVKTLAGDSNGPAVFASHALIPDTVVQLASLFTEQGGTVNGTALTDVVVDAIVARVATATTSVNFGDATVIQSLIQNIATRLGKTLASDLVTGAATVIAASNQAIAAVPAANNLAYLQQIGRIKHVAQGAVAQDLLQAARGQLTISALVAANTGVALSAKIAAATTPPILATTSPIQVQATGANGAAVQYAVAAHDIAGQSVSVVYSHPSGSVFPLGVTVVTATATDSLGNTAATSFTVTVTDTASPEFTVADLVIDATTSTGAFVTLPTGLAHDVVDPNPSVTYDHNSGFFPLGETLVTGTATDASGNVTTVQFLVTVVDAAKPIITVPVDILVEASESGGAFVTIPAITVTDLIDPNPDVVVSHSTGLFEVGTTVVTVTATDAAGNIGEATFTVRVRDTTPPLLATPGSIVVEANSPGGLSSQSLEVSATDLADPKPTITFDVEFLPLGTTLVTATATDESGNSSTSSFYVTAVDSTPPELVTAGDLVIEANVPGGAMVTLPSLPVTDLADPNPVVTYDIPSGFFPLGSTTVTATATDASGNSVTFEVLVTVVDTTPPVIAPVNHLVVHRSAPDGTPVTLPQLTVTDLADSNPVVTYNVEGNVFLVGTTLVTATAMDASGNRSQMTFAVTVVDPASEIAFVPAIVSTGASHAEGSPVTISGRVINTNTLAVVTEATLSWSAYREGSLTPFAVDSGVNRTDFVFTPDDDGEVRIVLLVTDQQGGTATDEVYVNIENAAPVIDVDYSVQGTAGNRIVLLTAQVTDPSSVDDLAAFNYTWEVERDGTLFAAATNQSGGFTFTPDSSGAYSVTLIVTDKDGAVSVIERELNIALPVATNASEETPEDQSFDGQLTATDGDDDVMTYALVNGPAHGAVTISSDGVYRYTPAGHYFGSDQFTFQVSDGRGSSNVATVTISVLPVNDAPVVFDATFATNEDVSLSRTLVASDADGDALIYSLVDGTAHGTVVINANGTFVYNPSADFFGDDQFTFQVTDGLEISTASVLIRVASVNDVPMSVADNAEGEEDSPVYGNLQAVDGDDDFLTYSVVTQPSHGSVTINVTTGEYQYTPALNFSGADSFSFRSNDGTASGASATVSIVVKALTDAPSVQNLSLTTNEDVAKSGTLVATSVDGVAPLFRIATEPEFGTLTLNPVTGEFTYTPAANFFGRDQFTYQAVKDSVDSVPATVSITVNPVNDAPVAQNQSITVPAGVSTSGVLFDSDVDSGTRTFRIVANPLHGSVTLNAATGAFEYIPATNYRGPDSFSYVSRDGIADSNTANVSLIVQTSGTIAPVLTTTAGTTVFVQGGQPVVVDSGILIVDLDSTDFSGGNLTVTIVTGGTAPDRLAIQGAGGISLNGANVLFNGNLIGTWSGGTNGTTPLVVTLTSAFATPAAVQALARSVVFSNTTTSPATAMRTIQFNVSDGAAGTSAVGLKTARVSTGVNAAPIVTTSPGTTSYAVAQSQIIVDGSLTVVDDDSADFNTGTLTVSFQSGISTTSILAIRNEGTGTGQVNLNGTTVQWGDVAVGSYTGGFTTNAPLVITWNSNATPAAVQAVARNITFQVKSSLPLATDRVIRFVLTDGDGGTSAAVTKTVTIDTPDANHSPTLSMPGPIPVYSKLAAPVAIDSTLIVTDPDTGAGKLGGGTLVISIDAVNTGRFQRDVLNVSALNAVGVLKGTEIVSGRRVMTFDLNGFSTAQNVQNALRQVTFATSKTGHKFPSRTVKIEIEDAAGNSTGVVSKSITVSKKRIR